jgi:2-polyprenyl-6-methoxyphenol hydroxylase-like FAD-dependent oxidoreductase
MKSQETNTDVIIVGGGPVGLTLAAFLTRFNIQCEVLEKDAGTTEHPRSRGLTVRTMEQFRQLGVEEAIRAGGLPAETDVFWICESVTGKVHGVTNPAPVTVHSPTTKCMVGQDVVQSVLATHLAERGVNVRWSTQALSFETSDDSVTLTTQRADGKRSSLTGRFLVAADGASSDVRHQVGIPMSGPEELGRFANHLVEADLSHHPVTRQAGMFIVASPERDRAHFVLNGNGKDRWLIVQPMTPDTEVLTPPEVETWTAELLGVPVSDVRFINSATWRMSAQVAERFCQDRVMLCGDAAHRFPPTGGFGLNSGVQDAHNLAWKLAFAIRNWAGESLLPSYESERRPVATSNTSWSISNSQRISSQLMPALRSDRESWQAFVADFDNHLHSEGQALGPCYASQVIDAGDEPRSHNARYYHPSDAPGGRFPHMWLDPERRNSTLDWFDDELVLVCRESLPSWQRLAQKSVGDSGVPVTVKQLPFSTSYSSIDQQGAVLVRPDGYVAWRAPDQPEALQDELTEAVRMSVGRL